MIEKVSYEQLSELLASTTWGEAILTQSVVEQTIEELTQKCVDYFVGLAAQEMNMSPLHFKDYALVNPAVIGKYFGPLLEIGIPTDMIRDYVTKDAMVAPHYEL